MGWWTWPRSFSNSSGMNNLGFWKSWCPPISLKFPCSCSRAPKNFLRHKYSCTFLFYRFNQSVHSPTRHHESVWRRKFFFDSGTPLCEFYWFLCASGFSKARTLHAWTITKRTMLGTPRDWPRPLVIEQLCNQSYVLKKCPGRRMWKHCILL